jgi:ABC-type multidrug transport system ATPase subunit
MPLLETQGLGKNYGPAKVLDRVSLAFEAGELVAVLGVNGAGKTTLLGCLAGILGWTRGEVKVDGKRLSREDIEQRRKLAMLPSGGLYFGFADTVRNAAIFSELWRGIDADAPLDLEEWLERLGLLEVAFQPLAELSRGQIYKASLLALHCADPEIWLLDEPFAAGMDARGMEAFRRLARHATGKGRCVIYTTQFPELAARFADRVIVIGHGGVLLDQKTAGRDQEDLIRMLGQPLGVQEAHA